MTQTFYDLAVIGGGPAGCSAAIRAADLGLRVTVLEAGAYPHDKLCGEFLSPECTGMLEQLGVWQKVRGYGPHLIETAVLSAPGGAQWQGRLPGAAWGLTRKRLDAALAERAVQAGVLVQERTSVTGLIGNLQEGFSVAARSGGSVQTIQARAVIAAYGKRSALDRSLGRSFLQRPQPYVAFKTHVRGLPLPGRIELHTFKGGYCGMSQIEDAEGGSESLSNLCFLAHLPAFQSQRRPGQKPLDAFLAWMGLQNEALRERLARAETVSGGWLSIAQVPFTSKSPVEGDLLMAGDAAGLIVPLAGDGIAMALRSGILAAGCVYTFLSTGQPGSQAVRSYERQWRQAFARRLAYGRFLQGVMLRPPLISAGLRLARALPAVGQFFIEHTRENGSNQQLPGHLIPGNRGS